MTCPECEALRRQVERLQDALATQEAIHADFVASYSAVETSSAPLTQQLRDAAAVSDLESFLAKNGGQG